MKSKPVPTTDALRQISPTDVSQFIRLEQCERYLRLRLEERAVGSRFMRDYGVVPQAIPPLLTRSGAAFEAAAERAAGERFPTVNLAAGRRPRDKRPDDNERVIGLVRELVPGAALVLFQPRLQAVVAGWRIRGDMDVLRLDRDGDGTLRVLIADMKSSTSAKVEHRLQVAFYHEMLTALFAEAGIACAGIDLAILYRGPAEDGAALSPEEAAEREAQRAEAARLFGTDEALLERVVEPESYLGAVRDLVTGSHSTASRVAAADFDAIPFHLTYKCDGCLYNEFCMKWSAERDDLSLLPHLTEHDKGALRRAGVTTTRELAALKELKTARRQDGKTASEDDEEDGRVELVPAVGKKALAGRLAATWPVGPRLDELVHRARRYRKFKGEEIEALSYIPSKGYGSLPYCDEGHNPNLVRVYVDAQHDYLNDRVYLLGALVAACEGGVESPDRRRSIVHLADGPPESAEREGALFVRWLTETVRAIVELAAPDAEGKPRAPVHLIFFNRFEQRLLLDGLGRHAGSILGATPLYDFVTQLAAFDSPVATFLDEEIRERKNYPMVCQSLQAVAAHLRFDWDNPQPYRDLFRARLFDSWGKLDAPESSESPWYTSRARFASQIPLEYAYAAWGELAPPARGARDDFAPYRAATVELLTGFQARRLEALEWAARDFPGNRQTEKRPFDLPDLTTFEEKARNLAQALHEFVTIERHVELGAWKAVRHDPPERRVLAGQTLIVRYEEGDQAPGVAERNRENERRRTLREAYRAAYREAHPDAKQIRLPKEEREESDWSQDGMRFRLRLEMADVDCTLDEALGLTTLRAGDGVVINRLLVVDERLPVAEQILFTPTPKQMLYGLRGTIVGISVRRNGGAVSGHVEVELRQSFGGGSPQGFLFGAIDERPLIPGERYTLDEDPSNVYAFWCAKVTEGLVAGGANTLYERLANPTWAHVTWPREAGEGQARFLAGLDALDRAGALHGFEPSKRDFIAGHGDAPTLLVQGPPGTGKSYSTAFALFARLQGAMAAGLDFRAVVSCKTHAATDVLLENVVVARSLLRDWSERHPPLFAEYFDCRLLDVPLFRSRPRGAVPEGVIGLPRDDARPADELRAADRITAERWCVVAATPGGIYGTVKEKWEKGLFGHFFCDCLVLDEASQLNLPEAAMAALPLKLDGQLIVVGDHRQMPPIVKHDWSGEPRRTFKEYRSYESLFQTLLPQAPPMIKFEESFRLHAEMAEFLRREIYQQDGIRYHSKRSDVLKRLDHQDPFVAGVLAPEHPIVVVVHDEAASQVRNAYEQALIAPLLTALAEGHGLDPEAGLGVVVPHRAQRAALQEAVPCLTVRDPVSGMVTLSAVDTVERFQGGERTVIVVGATESDRDYLLAAGEFLLDPRRLTVALSRAKRKMVLVAARSVFGLFSADEAAFAHAQLWKNLLRRTCTVKLWEGEREGRRVEVWGNAATALPGEAPRPPRAGLEAPR